MTTPQTQPASAMDRAVSGIYDALLDRCELADWVDLVCSVVGAGAAYVFTPRLGQEQSAHACRGISDADAAAYRNHYHRFDPVLSVRPMPAAGEWRLVRDEDFGPAFESSPFHREFLAPLGFGSFRAIVLRPPMRSSGVVVFAWFRRSVDGPYPAEADAALRLLARHLMCAERLAAHIVGAALSMRARAPSATLLLDPAGSLVATDDGGAAFIERGAFEMRRRRPRPASQEAEMWLHRMIGGRCPVVPDGPEGGPRIASLTTTLQPPAQAPMPCRLEWLPVPEGGRSWGLSARWLLVVDASDAPDVDDADTRQRAVAAYGWTRGEVDVVRRLARGQTPVAIASARACSLETVRTHVKNARRKAGVRRQVDLVTQYLRLTRP